MRHLIRCVLAAAAGFALMAGPAAAQTQAAPQAQTQCAEGRAANGDCVDASLATMLREGVRVFTQPKLSYSGAAVVPGSDHEYGVLRDRTYGLMREIYGPCLAGRCP